MNGCREKVERGGGKKISVDNQEWGGSPEINLGSNLQSQVRRKIGRRTKGGGFWHLHRQ